MKKEQIIELFEVLKELKEKRDIISETFKNFCKMVSSDKDGGFIVENQLEGFLKAIKILDPELGEELYRYVYEKGDNSWYCFGKIERNGKKYNITTDKEYLKYLIEEYTN